MYEYSLTSVVKLNDGKHSSAQINCMKLSSLSRWNENTALVIVNPIELKKYVYFVVNWLKENFVWLSFWAIFPLCIVYISQEFRPYSMAHEKQQVNSTVIPSWKWVWRGKKSSNSISAPILFLFDFVIFFFLLTIVIWF